MPSSSAGRSATASVSAGIAEANVHQPPPAEPGPRFPGEDGGHSLAEIAHRDLDAALQLLAERAQYITEASGAAIALRRGDHADMLCRASAGSNAPELGALLSMEYGLSGESVRTRQALRCDDAERDPRVNREGCRQLGIASVVVMPIVSEEQVLGVFELFSGRPHAFDERDLSALQRLSEMVETAVRHAVAAQRVAEAEEPVPTADGMVAEAAGAESPVSVPVALPPVAPVNDVPNDLAANELASAEPVKTFVEPEPETTEPEPAPKRPIFWSAAVQAPGSADETNESITVPPVLRNLQKCQACGFPVSQGRTLCVECEEKQWRGQRPAVQSREPANAGGAAPALAAAAPPQNLATAPVESAAVTSQASADSSSQIHDSQPDVPVSSNSTLFLSSTASSESWFAANKYVIGALLVVAIAIGAIVWLR